MDSYQVYEAGVIYDIIESLLVHTEAAEEMDDDVVITKIAVKVGNDIQFIDEQEFKRIKFGHKRKLTTTPCKSLDIRQFMIKRQT